FAPRAFQPSRRIVRARLSPPALSPERALLPPAGAAARQVPAAVPRKGRISRRARGADLCRAAGDLRIHDRAEGARARVMFRPRHLLNHRRRHYSQSGEDGLIDYMLRRLSGHTELSRYFVEFGAWDGRHLSNTFFLAERRAFGGLLIEADA